MLTEGNWLTNQYIFLCNVCNVMSLPQNEKITVTLLVRKLNTSDPKAYSLLFDLFWEDTYVHAFSLVQNEHTAKDIVQEIWIDVWNRRKAFHDKNFEAYLHKAVRNNCYKYFRSNKFNTVHIEVIESLAVYASKVEQKHNLSAMERKIERAIRCLPKRCQQIFRLSRYEDVPNEKIALDLGISKRTVENQLSKALKAIREVIYAE